MTSGKFWIAENPGRKVQGIFSALSGDRPRADLETNLTADPRVAVSATPTGEVRGYAVSALPARSVESFLPATLHGQLDTGQPVTLIEAQNFGAAGNFAPRYPGTAAMLGAHAADDEVYRAVRFKSDRPHWTGHLSDGEAAVVEDDESLLSVEGSLDGNWLVYSSRTPITLRQIEMRVTSACLALLHTALHLDEVRNTRDTEVRIDPAGPWLTVYGPAFHGEPAEFEHDTLFTREALTLERIAKWIALHDSLDGLTWVVARPRSDDVQTRIPLLTPLLEGFHRRLPGYQQAKFPDVSKSVLNAIRTAAKQAAVRQAEAAGLGDLELVQEANIFQSEVSFQDRAAAVVAEVAAVMPEIDESISNLPQRIKKARNELAHNLARKSTAPLRIRALEWLVVANATAWLLRCLLLLRAEFEPDELRARLLSSQRFGFYRANTAQHVKELGWDLTAQQG